jgi:hypothetical protein
VTQKDLGKALVDARRLRAQGARVRFGNGELP